MVIDYRSGNRLQLYKSFLKTMLAIGNWLLPSSNWLPESKTLLVKDFVKHSCATQCFEKLF